MIRTLLTAGVFLLAAPVHAGAPAPIPPPIECAFLVPVVVVGKITTIEKELVDAPPHPGAPKVGHTIAVVKIEKRLAGAAGLTHLRIGFVPPAKPNPNARRPDRQERLQPVLKEGQEMLFFLSKHPDGSFYAMPSMIYPVDARSADFAAQVECVARALAAVADPARALAAEKVEDRFHAALALITKYRLSGREGEVEAVPIPADENRLILQALADGDWKPDPKDVMLNGFFAIYRLGLSEADGWKSPAGKPNEEFAETTRKAFVEWRAGPGKDYRIKKFIPKQPK